MVFMNTRTRYSYNDIKEPRTPETGHTPLLPDDEPEKSTSVQVYIPMKTEAARKVR